ncbi:MAG: DNA alkylation repair protein [Lachnospiraceae bacterium]|nr:DNA alkylation repair protein [Lachnospiraceae bacterium]
MDFEYRIRKWLQDHRDLKYLDFNAGLIPNLPKKKFIGVRTPELRNYAKNLKKEGLADRFMDSLPHTYFEENQIHAFLISDLKDYEETLRRVEEFLPYIDNWATCDQLRPKSFKKNRERLYPYVCKWIHSDLTYTKRYAVGMLHYYYLDEEFRPEHLEMAAELKSGEYYVDMMNAWYFATALTKQYEKTLPLIEAGTLDPWVHNKAIQKARESRLIPEDRKAYLRTLQI